MTAPALERDDPRMTTAYVPPSELFDCLVVRVCPRTMQALTLAEMESREARMQAAVLLSRGLKRCNQCGLLKNVADFSSSGNGLSRTRPNCRPCHNARQIAYDRERGGRRHAS